MLELSSLPVAPKFWPTCQAVFVDSRDDDDFRSKPPNWAGQLAVGVTCPDSCVKLSRHLGQADFMNETEQDDANPDFVSLVCQFAHHESRRSYSD